MFPEPAWGSVWVRAVPEIISMKSTNQARPKSTPKKAMLGPRTSISTPLTTSHITPTSKTAAKIYPQPPYGSGSGAY